LLSLGALAERTKGAVQAEVLRLLHDESIALETLYGGPTARTCALRGAGRMLAREYVAAVPDLLRSLELRPGRHGPHQNLGLAYLRMGNYERSAFHLEQARLVRPFAWNTAFTKAQLLQARGELDAARAAALALSREGKRDEASRVPDLLGNIELERVMQLRWRGEFVAAREAAAVAVAEFTASLAVRDRPLGRQKLATAKALTEENPERVVAALAENLLEDPDSHVQLANLAFLLPAPGLGQAEVAWLAAVLRKIAWRRAGEDEVFKQRMLDEIELGLKPYR
jgi:tetratricopeptide (TPR) repeat protein